MTDSPIDLGAFFPTETVAFEILQPGSTTKGTGWVLQLVGPAHEQAVAYSNAQTKRSLAIAASQEQTRLNGKKVVVEERTPQEAREENVGWVTSRITGWNPVVIPFIHATEPTAYSAEMAIKVFSNPNMGWALEQLIEKFKDEKAFIKRSATE